MGEEYTDEGFLDQNYIENDGTFQDVVAPEDSQNEFEQHVGQEGTASGGQYFEHNEFSGF